MPTGPLDACLYLQPNILVYEAEVVAIYIHIPDLKQTCS